MPVFCSANTSAFRAGLSAFPAVVCLKYVSFNCFYPMGNSMAAYPSIDWHDEACNPLCFLRTQKQNSWQQLVNVQYTRHSESLPYATSHAVPSCFIKFWLIRAWRISSVIPLPLTIGVKTIPGATQLTLMPSFPWWAAMARVIWMIAPLVVGYRRLGFPPSTNYLELAEVLHVP